MAITGDEEKKAVETGISPASAHLPEKEHFRKIFLFVLGLLFDLMGMTTYFIPGITEIFDTIWAPIQAVLFYVMYQWKIAAVFSFAEEILPGTDFIPSFTIAWIIKYVFSKKRAPKRGNDPSS